MQRASDSARAVHALAYTAGRHLVFGAGQYSPTTASGRRLLAHELAHSVQQGFAPNPLPQLIGDPGNALERQADEAADGAVKNGSLPSTGNTISMAPTVQTTSLQRERVPPAPEIHEEEETSMKFSSTEYETVPPMLGPATCDDGAQMFCDTGNRGCPRFNKKGMTAAWANICYRCGPKGVYHRSKDEGTGVVRVGCGDTLTVTSQDNPDCSIEVKAIDHGPRKDTGNLVDLHPKAAEELWKCADKKAKGKFRCNNFKMPVSVSATKNTCPAAAEKPKG